MDLISFLRDILGITTNFEITHIKTVAKLFFNHK